MAAISNRGTTLPGAFLSVEALGAGNGFGRGTAGSGNRPLEKGAWPTLSALLLAAAAAFSARAPASPELPAVFSWAHTGRAKRAVKAAAAHQLRMCFLLKLAFDPADSRAPSDRPSPERTAFGCFATC